MFKIQLVNIKSDKQVVEFTSTVDTLAEAEVIAKGEIGNHIGHWPIDLIRTEDLVYYAISRGRDIGSVVIKSL